jgi:hypothetical protein
MPTFLQRNNLAPENFLAESSQENIKVEKNLSSFMNVQ